MGAAVGKALENPAVDGYLGVGISLLIMYTGFSTAKEAANLLVGVSADPELVEKINALITQGKGIRGTHDLRIHDYGPGRVLASVHAEVDEEAGLVEMHSEIDAIEDRIAEELGVKNCHSHGSSAGKERRGTIREGSHDFISLGNFAPLGPGDCHRAL